MFYSRTSLLLSLALFRPPHECYSGFWFFFFFVFVAQICTVPPVKHYSAVALAYEKTKT